MSARISRKVWSMCLWRSGSRSCKILSKDEMMSLQSIKQMQKRSQKLRSLQDKKKQCQKNLVKWAEEDEHPQECHRRLKCKDGQKIQRQSVAEAELDEKIRGLQAGDERRGSSAPQSSGCCMDLAFLQHFLTSRADLARQQLVLLQTEFGKTYGTQHQPAPVTLVHVLEGGEENDEEELRRRAASGENGPPVVGSRNERFLAGSVFDTSMPPRNAGVKAIQTSVVHLEEEKKVESERCERKLMGTNAEMHKADPGHVEEIGCREDEKERGKEESK